VFFQSCVVHSVYAWGWVHIRIQAAVEHGWTESNLKRASYHLWTVAIKLTSSTHRMWKVRFSGSLFYIVHLQHIFTLRFTQITQVAPITWHSSFFLMVLVGHLQWIIRASKWSLMNAARCRCECQARDYDVRHEMMTLWSSQKCHLTRGCIHWFLTLHCQDYVGCVH